ncbi:MAG TPA: phytanoyl-CoA dioxygenase family protein [Planctomycetota bacterium]|nr:phytanoyl-CoA dioxygenase family protein [Planctomycetota bacterium]
MPSAAASLDIATHVRAVTDAEVAFYHEHGWVKLPRLTTPEFAAELLRVGREWHERNGKQETQWNALAMPGRIEPYHALMFSDVMGRNAQRLVDRKRLSGVDVPMRYRVDHFVSKPPGSGGATYHQDSVEHGTDRAGELQFWLALAEVTADMGPMRFMSGVHREGSLGSVFREGDDGLLNRYPLLEKLYPLTPPIEYQPGDATVHHGYMVHGSGPNLGDRPRMSYIFSYTPADTRWWHGKVANSGSERIALGDESNPIVYPKP